MKKRLEKSVENAVVLYAKKKDIEAVKLNGMGKRSHPDRMFLGWRGKILFIEFKREGATPTPAQLYLHQRWWKNHGHKVYVIDNVADGKAIIDKVFR